MFGIRFFTVSLLLLVGLSTSLPSVAAVSGIRVSPTRLQVVASQSGTELQVTNLTRNEIAMQISVFEWSQKDGQMVLTPTRDILFSPPITKVESGDEQTVRFKVRRGADRDNERAYRVYIEQLLPPEQVRSNNFKLKFGVPFFLSSIIPQQPAYEVNIERDSGQVELSMKNDSKFHLKVSGIAAYDVNADQGSVNLVEDKLSLPAELTYGSSYLLPGSTSKWVLELPNVSPDMPLKYKIQTDYYLGDSRSNIGFDGALWIDGDIKVTASE